MNNRQAKRRQRMDFGGTNRRKLESSGSLFHYTTAAGLKGIIEEQCLFATHSNYLNDTAELTILKSVIHPYLVEEFGILIPKLQKLGAFIPEVEDKLSAIAGSEADRVFTVLLNSIQNVAPIFIASFCIHRADTEEFHHGLLSQWRGYGLGGFAIEFDEIGLDKLMLQEGERYHYEGTRTGSVAYSDFKGDVDAAQFSGMAKATYKSVFESIAPGLLKAKPAIVEALGNKNIEQFIGAFGVTVPFLKSPRFSEEREYRFAGMVLRKSRGVEGARPIKPIYFREKNLGTLTPYIKLFDQKDQKLPIKRIIVGPHRDQLNQQRAAQFLLEQFDVEAPVVLSDTTFRY